MKMKVQRNCFFGSQFSEVCYLSEGDILMKLIKHNLFLMYICQDIDVA